MSENANTPVPMSGRLFAVQLQAAPLPQFKEQRNGNIVYYGSDNLYPDYLLSLYRQATKHGAIIDGKCTYIAGKGLQIKDGKTDARAAELLAKANRYEESLHAVVGKAVKDLEIFCGAYLLVIWSRTGTRISEVYHLDFSKTRSNEDNTQFYWRKSWKHSKHRKTEKIYPAFNPKNPRGAQVLFLKEYQPGQETYPMPSYLRALNYISAEIEVGRHIHGNSKDGFRPKKIVTLTNGIPETEEELKKVTRKFKKDTTGADGQSFLLWFANKTDERPLVDDLGASDLTKEDFTAIDNTITSNTMVGHQVTTPALFGIATPGSLGQRTELEEGYEIFTNTYVSHKQTFLEQSLNLIARYAGAILPIEIIPADPLGLKFTPDQMLKVAPRGWALEKMGVDLSKYDDPTPAIALPGAAPQPGAQELSSDVTSTNEAVRSLSAKQHQQLKRIIREVGQGKTTPEAARVLIKSGLGLSDDDIDQLLGIKRTELADQDDNDDDVVIGLFSERGTPKADYTILKSRKFTDADKTADDQEFNEFQFMRFAKETISQLQADILDLISKDKRITPEVLAETLERSLKDVQTALDSLVETGALEQTGTDTEIERTLTKPLSDLQEGTTAATKSFQVMYSYEGPEDDRNRPFCARMMALNRFYTRADIETISLKLGYSAWDRRGGFWYNPETKETLPHCRHHWMSHIVKKNAA